MISSALLGSIILFGALFILILVVKAKNEKEYKAAMAEYERKMAEYNAAVAAIEAGGFAAAPVAAAAAPAAVAAPAPAVGEGEVKLIGVDEETAAMIIAILCDELGVEPSALVFHKITAL